MLLAPARKRNVQCDARRQHRRCRYENRTSARPVGSSRIRLHGVAGARKRGAMSLPGNHVGSRQCAIRPELRVKQTCQGYRSTDANDPTETWAAQDFRSAKALFVPSLKRDIVPLLHAHDLRREGSHGNPHPTARIHIHTGRRGSCVAARGARAAAGDAGDRVSLQPHRLTRSRTVCAHSAKA